MPEEIDSVWTPATSNIFDDASNHQVVPANIAKNSEADVPAKILIPAKSTVRCIALMHTRTPITSYSKS